MRRRRGFRSRRCRRHDPASPRLRRTCPSDPAKLCQERSRMNVAAPHKVVVRVASPADAPLILSFIRDLADYEKLLHEVEATEADIRRDLFGENPRCFCDIAEVDA